jgi:cysteine desulfurase
MIYADNGATTRLNLAAAQAMLACWAEYGNPSSLHEMGRRAAQKLWQARETMASCLDCKPNEIVFTSGGTEGDTWALRAAAALGKAQGKTHILSTAFEHPAVLNTLKQLEGEGFSVELLPVGFWGTVTAAQVEEAIRPETCLVSIMYANNEIGSILPIGEIGTVCRERGVLFHSDGVQAVGQLPISLREEKLDLLTLSAHKFGGPKGVGAVYVREGTEIPPLLPGGGQEQGRRGGTENVPGVVGMAVALQESLNHLEERTRRVTALRNRLIAGLSQIPDSVFNGDPIHRLPGNVNFSFAGVEGESLLALLDGQGICASGGSACSAGSIHPSHVLTAIGRSPELARGTLRLTLGGDNTPEEGEEILRAVTETVELLRQMGKLSR